FGGTAPLVRPALTSVPRTKFRSRALNPRFRAGDEAEQRRSGSQDHSRNALTLRALISYFSTLFWRKLQSLAADRLAKGRFLKRVLIVGAGKAGRELAAVVRNDASSARQIVGFLDDHCPVEGDVRGRFADLVPVARAEFVDEVIIALPCQSAVANR